MRARLSTAARVHETVSTGSSDRPEVRWPGGRSETFQQIQAGAIITIVG
jgi:hypothetical protein